MRVSAIQPVSWVNVLRLSGRKTLISRKIMTLFEEEVPTNLVPAVEVIREGQVLFVMTGRKGYVDDYSS